MLFFRYQIYQDHNLHLSFLKQVQLSIFQKTFPFFHLLLHHINFLLNLYLYILSEIVSMSLWQKHKLTKEDKKYNSIISRRRIYIEHVNRHIKKFRIVSTRYRNKRRKFALRFSLICAIYNFEL
ncbi:transposase family protein [Leptotrichia sp. HSP-536]|uniref:Transposase family protein n=1 Tax=Leptotrichia alba TaxID=3239304 RepID=A0AB39V7W0_9FUSO